MASDWKKQSILHQIILILSCTLGSMFFAAPVFANGYSIWNSHNPEICLDPIFDYYYANAITEAWIVRGDESLGRRLLQEYADAIRCNRDLGMVQAAYVYIPQDDTDETIAIGTSAIENSGQAEVNIEKDVPELKLGEVPKAEEMVEEWIGALKFREDLDGSESVPVGNWAGPPHFCVGSVTVWQDRARWMIGEWNARHRGVCIGSVVGRLRFDLRGDYVEPSATRTGEDIYRSTHRINAPFGGNWDLTETFRLTPSYVIRWSPRSTYIFEVIADNSRSSQTTSLSTRPINKRGREYPNISVAARGPVPFPDIPPTFNGQVQPIPAGQWDRRCRQYYANNGWPYPVNVMPISYQNHHVRPLSWNGPNNGDNCYRLQANHHYFFSVWWLPRSNFETPLSR